MRRILGVLAAACCAAVTVGGCKCGTREPATAPAAPPAGPALTAVSETPAVLAEIPADEKPLAMPTPENPAGELAPMFAKYGGGVAYVAERGGKYVVVHNGRAGKGYAGLGAIALSADGRRCAYVAQTGEAEWRVVVDGQEGPAFADIGQPMFSPDGAHLAYNARVGSTWHLVLDGKRDAGTQGRYLNQEFSADSTRLVFLEETAAGAERLGITDLALEQRTILAESAWNAVLNVDNSRVAMVVPAGDGAQERKLKRVISLRLDAPGEVSRGKEFEAIYGPVFGPDGASVAYLGRRGETDWVVVLDGKEDKLPPGDDVMEFPVVRPTRDGVGAFVASNGSMLLREFFRKSGPEEVFEGAEGLVYSPDGRDHAYAGRTGGVWFVVVNGKRGPELDRVVGPAFTPDGKYVVYRARRGQGKRFLVVADREGKTVREHPAYEQVFDFQFTKDGKSVAYGVKNGNKLEWKVEPI